MPQEIVERLAHEMAVVLAKPEVREQLARLAFEARSSSPQELTAFVAEQLEAYRRVVRLVGISLD
jgi:tripartite-type tricarboxylate transporter receptor subunit TctC